MIRINKIRDTAITLGSKVTFLKTWNFFPDNSVDLLVQFYYNFISV